MVDYDFHGKDLPKQAQVFEFLVLSGDPGEIMKPLSMEPYYL